MPRKGTEIVSTVDTLSPTIETMLCPARGRKYFAVHHVHAAALKPCYAPQGDGNGDYIPAIVSRIRNHVMPRKGTEMANAMALSYPVEGNHVMPRKGTEIPLRTIFITIIKRNHVMPRKGTEILALTTESETESETMLCPARGRKCGLVPSIPGSR